ncbi:unnamed protein product [Paramecium pentaurelia]|uniref:Transmembrane protein n=1 Tax=Paramecium pentaurelia TaxID=43138 RepID=A0A8S1VQ63_9CILI|nr:unnamed protein product [Paramecium pentaurelia]
MNFVLWDILEFYMKNVITIIEKGTEIFQESQCYNCSTNIITPFIFSFLWAIISILITLKSIEKSNLLFSKIRFKLRYRKILFIWKQILEGIFIKILFIYLRQYYLLFNIKFSISFSFIDPTSNNSQLMASSLDCYLSMLELLLLFY